MACVGQAKFWCEPCEPPGSAVWNQAALWKSGILWSCCWQVRNSCSEKVAPREQTNSWPCVSYYYRTVKSSPVRDSDLAWFKFVNASLPSLLLCRVRQKYKGKKTHGLSDLTIVFLLQNPGRGKKKKRCTSLEKNTLYNCSSYMKVLRYWNPRSVNRMNKTQFPLVSVLIQLKLSYSWSGSFEQWDQGNNVRWLLNIKQRKQSGGWK